MNSIGLVYLMALFLLVVNCFGADLKPPFDFPTAKTLPKKVKNIRYKGLFVQATDKFSNSGESVQVGDALNAPITWGKMIEGQLTEADRGALRGYILGKGYSNLDEEVGTTSGVANVSANAMIPVFAYGVTERLTLGMAIPIIKSNVKVDTGFIQKQRIVDFTNEMRNAGMVEEADKVVSNINRPISKKLEDYGYSQLEDETSTKLGDIKLVSKYKLKENKYFTFSLLNEVTLPTGKETSVNKALDVPSGDGQTDVGVGLATDYKISNNLVLSNSMMYTAQLPDKTRRRVPEKTDSSLTPDIDDSVDRDLGDIFQTSLALSYSLIEGVAIKGGYSLQYKSRDDYSGAKYRDQRYDWMGDKTVQNMHTALASIGYSTLSLFRKKKFAVPLEASITYSSVFRGKNVVNNPMLSFELVAFF